MRQVRGRSFRFPENRSKIGLAAENRSNNPWPAEEPLRTRKNVQPHGETFKNMAIRGKSFNKALAGQKSPRTRKNVQPYGETFKKGLSAGKRSKVHIWTLRSASARPAAPTGILASVPRRSARPCDLDDLPALVAGLAARDDRAATRMGTRRDDLDVQHIARPGGTRHSSSTLRPIRPPAMGRPPSTRNRSARAVCQPLAASRHHAFAADGRAVDWSPESALQPMNRLRRPATKRSMPDVRKVGA